MTGEVGKIEGVKFVTFEDRINDFEEQDRRERRDRFAMAAMTGLLARPDIDLSQKQMASLVLSYVDDLIEKLDLKS